MSSYNLRAASTPLTRKWSHTRDKPYTDMRTKTRGSVLGDSTMRCVTTFVMTPQLRGEFADIPQETMLQELRRFYPNWTALSTADFEADVTREVST